MNAQRLSCVVLLALSSLWPGCSVNVPAGGEPVAELNNVVVIVVDALRADRVRGRRNGMPLMPKTARFAKEALCFTNAVSQASWTKPSMVSIFTSLYPDTHGVQFGIQKKVVEGQDLVVDGVPDAFETMAEYLKDAGYHTLAVQTNHQLKGEHGFDQGFDQYRFDKAAAADRVTDAAIEELAGVQEPFFLYLHYLDPHSPYDPPERYRGLFGPLPRATESDLALLKPYNEYYLDKILYDMKVHPEREKGSFSDSGKEYVRYLYDGEVRFADDEVARLIDFIERRFPGSVIVFTADHGEEFWEHGSIGHGKSVYQESIHVPLVMKLPGWTARDVAGSAETVDILPTVAAYLGLPPNHHWQGRNLLPLLEKATLPDGPVFAETRGSLAVFNLWAQSVALGTDKLVVKRAPDRVRLEYYDLAADPFEQSDKASDHLEDVARLRRILAQHDTENQEHPMNAVGPVRIGLDEETLDGFKALGYFDSEEKSAVDRPGKGAARESGGLF